MLFGVKESTKVHEALMNGLDEMRKQYVERVISTLYESEPDPSVTGRFIRVDKEINETNYYPFDKLTKDEQLMIWDGTDENKNGGKSYTVIALALRDLFRNAVEGKWEYSVCGVEEYHRTHIIPFLSKLKPQSNLNYVTKGGIYTGNQLKEFAKGAEKDGWTEEDIKKRIKWCIQEWHDETIELMDKAGVFERKASKGMENGSYMPKTDMILSEMRAQIENAKKA